MKTFLLIVVALMTSQAAFSMEENSILYPKQIQPKLTIKQQCQLDDAWKEYESMGECISTKRHEEIVAQQIKTRQRLELLADNAHQDYLRQRATEREHHTKVMIMETLNVIQR